MPAEPDSAVPRKPNRVDRIEMVLSQRRRPGGTDALPEDTPYVDRGCGNGCTRSLECPFPRCRYDDPPVSRSETRVRRDAAILRARAQEGLSVSAIARRFNIGTRTVYRALQHADAAPDPAEKGKE